MNKILVITVALLLAISSSLYAGPFGLFGRRSSGCANGSCSRSTTVTKQSTTEVACAKCDCKCGCDLCKCATENCKDNSGNCSCTCGCPNCTCEGNIPAVTIIIDGTTNTNNSCDNSCKPSSGSCATCQQTQQNSQTTYYSQRQRTVVRYGRPTPIRNFIKKVFHR